LCEGTEGNREDGKEWREGGREEVRGEKEEKELRGRVQEE